MLVKGLLLASLSSWIRAALDPGVPVFTCLRLCWQASARQIKGRAALHQAPVGSAGQGFTQWESSGAHLMLSFRLRRVRSLRSGRLGACALRPARREDEGAETSVQRARVILLLDAVHTQLLRASGVERIDASRCDFERPPRALSLRRGSQPAARAPSPIERAPPARACADRALSGGKHGPNDRPVHAGGGGCVHPARCDGASADAGPGERAGLLEPQRRFAPVHREPPPLPQRCAVWPAHWLHGWHMAPPTTTTATTATTATTTATTATTATQLVSPSHRTV
jgi:hypothetical protein